MNNFTVQYSRWCGGWLGCWTCIWWWRALVNVRIWFEGRRRDDWGRLGGMVSTIWKVVAYPKRMHRFGTNGEGKSRGHLLTPLLILPPIQCYYWLCVSYKLLYYYYNCRWYHSALCVKTATAHHVPIPVFVIRDAKRSLVLLQRRLDQDNVKLALKVAKVKRLKITF